MAKQYNWHQLNSGPINPVPEEIVEPDWTFDVQRPESGPYVEGRRDEHVETNIQLIAFAAFFGAMIVIGLIALALL